MNIVILDAYTANPGDHSWDPMKELGHCDIYDRTAPDQVTERSRNADIVLVNKTKLRAEHFEQLPRMKYVGVMATGFDVVDIAAARRHGVVVTNVPAYSTPSVAQMVFAHLLAICNRVEHYTSEVRQGRWANSKDFCFIDTPLIELCGKTMGIVGMGSIGRAASLIAQQFGMRVLATTSQSQDQLPAGVEKTELEQLLSRADVVSLHCPLSPKTKNLINAANLRLMKPTAIVINTARGPVVNAHDLAAALNEGRIMAAGIDVLETEPPTPDNPLLTARNCFITPHIAWAARESRQRLLDILTDNVRAFLNGNPQNVVS